MISKKPDKSGIKKGICSTEWHCLFDLHCKHSSDFQTLLEFARAIQAVISKFQISFSLTTKPRLEQQVTGGATDGATDTPSITR